MAYSLSNKSAKNFCIPTLIVQAIVEDGHMFFEHSVYTFSVLCCLHREHCVNSVMRHRSDCRGALQVTVVTVTVMHKLDF